MSKSIAHQHPLPYFFPYIVPILTVITQFSSEPWHTLIPSLLVWIIVPLLDLALPATSHQQLTITQRKHLDSNPVYSLAVSIWCPTHLALLTWSANRITTVTLHPVRLVGLLLSISLVAAEGVNVSHELLHRRNVVERFLAKILLVSVQYGHFTIEHAKGHHFHAATPLDPATLRFGESFYKFLPRTVVGGYISAWRIECGRLRKQNSSIFTPHNEMLQFAVAQLSFLIGFGLRFGGKGLALVLFQSAFAVLLLEQVNAIEHYGLTRRLKKNGRYEAMGPQHSWDSPRRVSNYIMFKLQLHPDHHLRTFIFLLAIFRIHSPSDICHAPSFH